MSVLWAGVNIGPMGQALKNCLESDSDLTPQKLCSTHLKVLIFMAIKDLMQHTEKLIY